MGLGSLRIAFKSVPKTNRGHRLFRAAAGGTAAVGWWGMPVSG
jgi:hypothetical protein